MKKIWKYFVAVVAFLFGVWEFYDNWFEDVDFGDSIRVDNTEIYYAGTDSIQAHELADYLKMTDFIDGNEKSVRLLKIDTGYVFQGVYTEDAWNDSTLLVSGLEFAKEMSLYVFESSPLTFQLCDDMLEMQNQVTFDVNDEPFGWEYVFGETELFFTKRVDYKEAEQLGNLLTEMGYTEQPSSVQLDKSDSAYHFNQVTIEEYWYDENYLKEVESSAQFLSDSLFNGERVVFALCDDEFNVKAWASN